MFRENKLVILNTKKIFSYDHIEPNNMNEYIKDYRNLIVFIKLPNGVIIGGFSADNWKSPT